MDIKYKGISKKDITKIQEIHMPKYSIPPTIDDYALAQLRSFECKEISDEIDNGWKQNENDLNIYIVCEMAKKYLDVMKEKKYCCTCKWYAEFEGVCCNADSKWTADFRCLEDTCEYWKPKGGKMSREEAYSTMLDYVSSVGGCGAEYWSDKDADKMRECLRILMFGTDDLDEL